MANEDLRIVNRAHAEDVLQHERGFAESLITTAQAIVLVLDTEGRIVRFNPYMEEISGYRLKEVPGKDWFTNSDGNVVGLLSIGQDITERKAAEAALRIERDNLINILESIEDGIYIEKPIDPYTIIREVEEYARKTGKNIIT